MSEEIVVRTINISGPELEDWQQRVLDEYNELYDKAEALTKFIESPKFDNVGEGEQRDLRKQREIMISYISILDSRIMRF